MSETPKLFSGSSFSLALMFCITLALVPVAAQAQEDSSAVSTFSSEVKTFDISAGPLSQVLSQFAGAVGVALSFDATQFNHIASPGLQGTYSVQQGFAVLLANTGKTAVRQANGDYVLQDVSATTLPPVQVRGEVMRETATSPVTGYAAKYSATGTKTDTPIIETPASVQVIPGDVIEAQQAVNLKDVYENISGVQQAGNTMNAQSEVLPVIRGFESPTLLRNGLRATTAGAVDLVNIERVEVLKGPASILYGALEPGGVVSYVTKRPQTESRHVAEQELGSEQFRRTTMDSTGAINQSATWMYRLNAAHTDSDSFRDAIELERTAIAPSFLWAPDKNTELLLDFSYTRETQPYDSGIPLSSEGTPLVPDSTFFGDPDLQGRENEDYYASYQLTHRINPVWKIRNQLQLHRADNSNESIRNRGVINNDTEMRQRYQIADRVDDENQFVVDGIATFSSGNVDHELLIGTEYVKLETEWQRFRQNLPDLVISASPDVNFEPPATMTRTDDPSETQWWSLYLQDQMSLLEDGRLKMLLGARFDDVETTGSSNGEVSPEVNDSALTARSGLLYMLNAQNSLYVSASQSFRPQFAWAVDANGIPLDPETGQQLEAGLKRSFFNEQLTATFSLYQIEKEDVAVFDQALFNETGQTTYFPGVKERSEGFELDIAGQLTPQMRVLANYSYTDTEILENEGDPSQIGEPLGGVSRHLARLWLTYDFDGALTGFGLGGGVRYVGKSSAQFDTDLPLKSYTVADLGMWYQWNRLRVSFKVNNLFDEEYITRASDASIAHPGIPRSVLVGLSFEF